jgi:signal transduction histidine kinase
MNQPTVVIISDDADFSRTLVSRWQTERSAPAFTLVGSNVWQGTSGEYDVAIVAPMPAARLFPILSALDAGSAVHPSICLCNDAATQQQVRDGFPRVLLLRDYEGWVEALVLLGAEVLRRLEAATRGRRAEQLAAASQRNATLGRYMLEMRHSINNALTSVLGNAELLLLDPGALSPDIHDQIETMHSMALRMHQILQRFSSLDAEMQFAERQSERQSQSETKTRPRGYAASS